MTFAFNSVGPWTALACSVMFVAFALPNNQSPSGATCAFVVGDTALKTNNGVNKGMSVLLKAGAGIERALFHFTFLHILGYKFII